MSELVWIAGIVAYLVAYFAAGWYLAKRDLANAWMRARKDWYDADSIRGSVKAQTACLVLLWPLLTSFRAVSARFSDVVDAGDPRAREKALARREEEVAARERKIARLEHELGIGSSS